MKHSHWLNLVKILDGTSKVATNLNDGKFKSGMYLMETRENVAEKLLRGVANAKWLAQCRFAQVRRKRRGIFCTLRNLGLIWWIESDARERSMFSLPNKKDVSPAKTIRVWLLYQIQYEFPFVQMPYCVYRSHRAVYVARSHLNGAPKILK